MSTPAPDVVRRLIDRFDQDRKVFQSGNYKEEQLRATEELEIRNAGDVLLCA
jgi:hypothetical protein